MFTRSKHIGMLAAALGLSGAVAPPPAPGRKSTQERVMDAMGYTGGDPEWAKLLEFNEHDQAKVEAASAKRERRAAKRRRDHFGGG